MNKYLEKIASLGDIAKSTIRVAGNAVRGAGEYAASTFAGAAGEGKMKLINQHMFAGKANSTQLSSTYHKFNGLKTTEDVTKFHAALGKVGHQAPSHEELQSTVANLNKKQLDDKVKSGILAGGALYGVKKLHDKIQNQDNQYGAY